MLNLIKTLCNINAAPSGENEIAKSIINEIKEHCENVSIDTLGNIIAFKKGEKPAKNKIMMSCHLDEVSFIIKYIQDDGKLMFAPVGGIEPKVVAGKVLEIGKNKVKGVVCTKPIHLCNASERSKVLSFDEMLLDIGAKSKSEVENLIQIGDFTHFNTKSQDFGDDCILAKALDDRIGCGILIDIIKSKIKYDAYFCFTTREEVGCIGASTAAFSVKPDVAIVVECTTAADNAGKPISKIVCGLGKGAVISFMDKGAIYDNTLYKKAIEVSEKNNIKYQVKTGIYGGNDASMIQKSAGGCKVIALSVAGRNLHSQSIIVKKEDIISVREIAFNLLNSIN